jgi:uncharacterized protein
MAQDKKKNEKIIPVKPSLVAERALKSIGTLPLLGGLFQDEAGQRFLRLLKWLARDGEPDVPKGRRRYGHLWQLLGEQAEFTNRPRAGNALQDYFLERLLDDPNLFHRKAELAPLSQMGSSMGQAYLRELEIVQKILKTDWEAEFLKRSGLLGVGEVPSMDGIKELAGREDLSPSLKAQKRIKEKILSGSKGHPLVAEVAEHFYENGWGPFGRYRAFRWAVSPEKGGSLLGVEPADPILLENLVGYDEQRKPLIENIEAFVAGKLANNVLLYGERGTGKSSTVKALLNAYQEKGLRLVEVLAADLKDIHDILKPLRSRREKFILFVDDLSFEENETSYKGLKALLEGTVEAPPANVILIATSNRRHLVREFFGDRAGGLQKEGEIHGADTVEEKLSLSDRFGLVISFYTPDQDTYLKIVDNWARVEGIKMPAKDLHAQAIQWEKANNVRSGRTARQFINDLKGKTG